MDKYSNWKAAGQQKEFKRMHRKMDKKLDDIVDDFRTIVPTQKKMNIPGRKFTLGTIDPKKARRRK